MALLFPDNETKRIILTALGTDDDEEYEERNEEINLPHLDEKTRELDKLITTAFTLGKFIQDTEGKTDTGQLEDAQIQNLNYLADFSLGNKKINEKEKEIVRKTIEYAIDHYMERRRDRGELFFQHSLRVARKIHELGGDLETKIAGLVHDVIEEEPKYRELKTEYKETDKKITKIETKLKQTKENKTKQKELTQAKAELEKIKNQYNIFKARSLKNMKDFLTTASKETRIQLDVESVAEIVNKLTRNIYDKYYEYQEKMFNPKGNDKEEVRKPKLLQATRVMIAKGCDREDNMETMEKLEAENEYSFTTQQRLSATYKNITTINRMRNFLNQHEKQLKNEKLRNQYKITKNLFYKLLESTLDEIRKDRQHLEKEHKGHKTDQMTPETQKDYERRIKRWDPPSTIKTKHTRTEGEIPSDFDLVIEKYDRWLHYSKEGLSTNRENFAQQYADCLAFEKILEKFNHNKQYTLKYRALKELHENDNN